MGVGVYTEKTARTIHWVGDYTDMSVYSGNTGIGFRWHVKAIYWRLHAQQAAPFELCSD